MGSSFWSGFANVLNVAGEADVMVPVEVDGFAADSAAIGGDWRRVGDELIRAAEAIAAESTTP